MSLAFLSHPCLPPLLVLGIAGDFCSVSQFLVPKSKEKPLLREMGHGDKQELRGIDDDRNTPNYVYGHFLATRVLRYSIYTYDLQRL